MVLEVQGLIGEYEKHYWGGMALGSLVRCRTYRDWLRLDGLIEQRWKWRHRADRSGNLPAHESCHRPYIVGPRTRSGTESGCRILPLR